MSINSRSARLLVPLLVFASPLFASDAPVTLDQMKAELSGSESRLRQSQQDSSHQLAVQMRMLQAQQEKNRQQMLELKKLQQQLAKQLQSSPATRTMSQDQKSECLVSEPGLTTPDGKLILGESEWVFVEEAEGAFQSRVDTGAATSSISATDITVFEREGKRWVKFNMPLDNGQVLPLEAPFVRYVRIRQASADAADRRPVVRLSIKLGSLTEKAEFSLKDRSEMDFSLLLGREFIKDVAVVDVAREFVQPKPDVATLVPAKRKAPAVAPKSDAKTDKSGSSKAQPAKAEKPAASEIKPATEQPAASSDASSKDH